MAGGWFVGIDAGGTATKCRLYKQGVGLVGEGTGPAGNVWAVGADGVAESVWQALTNAAASANLAAIPPIKVLAACVAGARGKLEQSALQKEISNRLEGASVIAFPDAAAGLTAGTLGKAGVVVISGTGSAVWSLSAEEVWQRAGGWGYLLGDEGSGFAIGLAALKSVVQAADGLGPSTELLSSIIKEWNLSSPQDLTSIVYVHPVPRDRIASLAPLVLGWAQRGDAVAEGIVSDNIRALVRLATVGVDRAGLGGSTPVIVVGGVFNDEGVLARFTDETKSARPQACVRRPRVDPAAGACILALQHAGVWTPQEREILLTSFSQRTSSVKEGSSTPI